ncbi:hypothetical protein GJ688_07330 [Heliobacillus mobilis]|uniref:Peptidase propeptide and YPEB domain-containing protein n=1 Tax=Heliobacterium mobile TaxID=28064 RepID=A0A6I3SIT0_HELMO|nr:hypothetical protein [Heliobacterium mobile]MTV48791.1 hypothetical protein [Heliobacterium mobile]
MKLPLSQLSGKSFRVLTAGVVMAGLMTTAAYGNTPAGVEAKSALAMENQVGASTGSETRATASQMEGQAPERETPPGPVQKKMDEFIAKISQFYPELNQMKLLYLQHEASYQEESGQAARVWYVHYIDPRATEKDRPVAYQVSFTFDDKDGSPQSFHLQNPSWASLEDPSPSLAKEKATEFFEKLFETQMKDYEVGDSFGGGASSVSHEGKQITWRYTRVAVERRIHGIPLQNSGPWSIDVDGSGNIVGMNISKETDIDLTRFPDPSSAISPESAKKAFADQMKMELLYMPQENLNKPGNGIDPVLGRQPMRLVYQPNVFISPLNAFTGKPDSTLYNFTTADSPQKTVQVKGEGKAIFCASVDEVRKKVKAEFGLPLNELDYITDELHEKPGPVNVNIPKIHTYNFIEKRDPSRNKEEVTELPRYAAVEVESDTGRLVGIRYQEGGKNNKTQPISIDRAREKAIQLILPYLPKETISLRVIDLVPLTSPEYPEWVDKTKISKNDVMEDRISFLINPLYNGIPIEGMVGFVSVDKYTGNIVTYHAFPIDLKKLPLDKPVVTLEKAKETYLQKLAFEKKYIWPKIFDQRAPKPSLFYIPDFTAASGVIDAYTGELIPYVQYKK